MPCFVLFWRSYYIWMSTTFLPISHVPILVAEKQLLFSASLNTDITQRLLLFFIKLINLALPEQNPSIQGMSSLVFYCTWQGQVILVINTSLCDRDTYHLFNFTTACSVFAIPDEKLWKFTVNYSTIKLHCNNLLGITVVKKEARDFSTILKAYFPFVLPLQDMPFITSFI